jgi:transcriptional regulator with XRE-family HTH domain
LRNRISKGDHEVADMRNDRRVDSPTMAGILGKPRPHGVEGPTGTPLGERLRTIRQARKWTLHEASKRSSVGRSTLSKIENGLMSPTLDLLKKITRGMEIDLVDLFNERSENSGPRGRRSITRRGEGKVNLTKAYRHELLATDISKKRMLPFRTIVTARSLDEFDNWESHDGEEVLIVMSGTVEVHTEYYAPARLEKGDSIYFDSRMGHCVVSVGEGNAEVVWVCSGAM